MNEEKLEEEIGGIHDSLNKTMALLRGISACVQNAEGRADGKEERLKQVTAIGDMGLIAEIAVEVLQKDVYERLERLPKALEEA